MNSHNGNTPQADGETQSDAPRRAFDEDFLRGEDEIVGQLTKTLARAPDVGQPHSAQSWDTMTRLAWRPAWSIRSRRGALKPLIDWWRDRQSKR